MANLCDKHLEPYSLYCNQDTCHKPICNKCASLHPSHEVFNTQTFADYLFCVADNELQTYAQCTETLNKHFEDYSKVIDQLIQNTVTRVKRMQTIISTIQDTLNGYVKTFEEKSKLLLHEQENIKNQLEILNNHFKEKMDSYSNMGEIITSKSQSGFADLYQIWLHLNDQISIELAQEEIPQYFSTINYADTAASEISGLTVNLNNLLANISSWTWINGFFLLTYRC